jgi:hypothetical protein
MQIDIETIKQQLFSDNVVRSRIVRDYGVKSTPANANEFASSLLALMEQAPVPHPLDQSLGNRDVFRAAVKALGSNSRAWATFLKHERRLAGMLGEYDPRYTHQAAQEGSLSVDQIKACLPGQSSSGDARAILRWAQLLMETENYYAFIQDLGTAFRTMNKQRYGEALTDTDLLLCLVGYLGDPPTGWVGSSYLSGTSRQIRPEQHKTPGMGYILASEFLRNLGWNGFKPDRHVQRLFDRWLPGRSGSVQPMVARLCSLIDRRVQSLKTYLTYSLIGN